MRVGILRKEKANVDWLKDTTIRWSLLSLPLMLISPSRTSHELAKLGTTLARELCSYVSRGCNECNIVDIKGIMK